MVKSTSSRRGLMLAAAASAFYAFLVGRKTAAQEVPLDTGADGTAAALAALRAELDELQRKVERMESEKGRIQAPLTVVDEAGSEVVTIGTFGSGPFLRVGAAASQNCTITAGALPALTFAEGEANASVYLKAGRDPLLLIVSEAGSANMGTLDTDQGARQGFSVNATDGTPLFGATTDERNPLVVFDKSGKPFFAVSHAADRPRVIVGEPSGPGLFVGGTENGFSMSLLDATMGERLVLRADATDTVIAINNAGKPVAQIGTIDNTPTMILGDPLAASVTATATPGGDGAGIVISDQSAAERVSIAAAGGSTTFALKRQGDTPLLSVTDVDQDSVLILGDGAAANFTASIRANGGSLVSIKDASQAERFGVLLDGENSTLSLYTPEGLPFLDAGLRNGTPVLEIGRPDGAGALLGADPDKGGGVLILRDQSHAQRAYLTATPEDTRLTLNTEQASVLDVGITEGVPQLVVGKTGEAGIQFGVTSDKRGSFLSALDASGAPRAYIRSVANGAMFGILDENMFARLGTTDDSGERYGLYIGKDDLTIANLRFGSTKEGSVSVGNGGPKLVCGIAASDEGGRFIALDGAGQKEHAAIGSRAEGGFFTISDPGGPLVHAETEGYGQLTVEGSSGSIVMIGGADAPRLELGVGGQALVQLAVTVDGVGKVLTGPGSGGPAGSLGAGLEIASSIQGKPGGSGG
jgi:hypothetical protein